MIARWTLLIGGLALVSLGVAIWLGLKDKAGYSGVPVRTAASQDDFLATPQSQFVSLSEKEALSLVKNALGVREPGQVSEYFRQREIPPADVVKFLQSLESLDGPIERYEWVGSLDANGLTLDGVLVFFQSAEGSRNRLAHLVPDPQGKWKIDFDSFARAVTPPWTELTAGWAEVGKVRVHVVQDSYYNGLFKDENEWLSVGFASPDTEDVLTGYCRIGSPQAAAMKWLFAKDTAASRATLEIRRVEGAEPRQVLISRVLAEDWVMGEQPFDERFK